MVTEDVRRQSSEAIQQLEAGNYVNSLAITDRVLAAGADNASLRCLRANALLRMGQPHESIAEARSAVELGPQNPTCHLALAWAAWEAENWKLAQESLEAAVRWSDRDPQVLTEYARFMACCRGPRLAWRAAREAVAANPESSAAWAALALAQHRMHRYGDAEESIARALKLDPNDLLTQSLTMSLLEAKGETGKAAALAQLMRDMPGGEQLAETFQQRQRERAAVEQLLGRQQVQRQLIGETDRRRGLKLRICLLIIPPLMAAAVAPIGAPAALTALAISSIFSWRMWPYVE